mgnify:CR=1 FL=1
MKQFALTLFFLCTACTGMIAQKHITSLSPSIYIKGIVKDDIGSIKAGTPFTLQRFVKLTQYQPTDPNYRQAVLIINGRQQGVALNNMDRSDNFLAVGTSQFRTGDVLRK